MSPAMEHLFEQAEHSDAEAQTQEGRVEGRAKLSANNTRRYK